MLIDMHIHSSGISGCCRLDIFGIVDAAKNAGLDGIFEDRVYELSE